MKKQHQHRQTRNSAVARGIIGAAALTLCAAGAQGAVVYFDNPAGPGHYDWVPPVGDLTHWLDITKPAIEQPAPIAFPTAIQQQRTASNSRLQRGYPDAAMQLEVGGPSNAFIVGVGAGVAIPSGLAWYHSGYINQVGSEAQGLQQGVASYVGFRFNPGDGLHYGWVEVVRDGWEVEALSWAYETEPGVPIVAGVPAPGAVSALGLAGLAAAQRRRR